MDKTKEEFKYKCPRHPEFKIEYLQIDGLDMSQRDKNLFHCYACFNQDSTFKWQNYQLIKEIVKYRQGQILPKWPPINDSQVLNQIIQITKREGEEEREEGEEEDKEQQLIVKQIETYFKELKDDIVKEIDICQKKMIQHAQDLPEIKVHIQDRYQQMSKINELRSILLQNQTDLNQKEIQYRLFLENILPQKKSIFQQLNTLINQYQQQAIFQNASALSIKQSILKSISSINFFDSLNIPHQKNDNKNSINYKNYNNNNNDNINNENNKDENNNNNRIELDMKLVKGELDDGQDCLEIRQIENKEYTVMVREYTGNCFNTVSDIVLERNKKYVFRIEIKQMNEGEDIWIGLMREWNVNKIRGCDELMCCRLRYMNGVIGQDSEQYQGIANLTKGDAFVLSAHNTLEMRVSIADQLLQVSDYPLYASQLDLQREYIDNLIHSELLFFLGMQFVNNLIVLKDAFSVDHFI